jgi:thiosulfate/3-mercaptopyruvate sulfurtransferase
MTRNLFLFIAAVLAITALAFQTNEPWTDKQLMAPADLAKILNDAKSTKPLVYSIGFAGGIKGSKEMGAARDKVNLDKLRAEIEKLPKNSDIVIYCGCCPFANCPNVRPAFKLLNEMKFTNARLLNLSHNLKADWIDKGYPVE